MYRSNFQHGGLVLLVVLLLTINFGCTPKQTDKIPITTSSKEAKQLFLQGRNLFEKLQVQKSLQYFQQAVEKDPKFAMAYLFLANAQPTTSGFFKYLEEAVSLANDVSAGERDWILGIQAGAEGLPKAQFDYYQALVNAYPNDEHAYTLLGDYYIGQQDWQSAINEYNQAVQIAPSFSPSYNQLGYAYRFEGNYSDAEEAFKKYIALIPNDPNPYDSYAEMLMKIGRFEESVEEYRQALVQDSNFVSSYLGIASDLNFLGKYNDAREELQKLHSIARNDGERRAAFFGMAVSYVDEGNLDKALEMITKQYELASKINDAGAMSRDLTNMGNILLQQAAPDDASQKFNQALEVVEKSDLPADVKANARRLSLYNTARVAVAKKDIKTADSIWVGFDSLVAATDDPNQIRLSHELEGIIALADKQYSKAIRELQQANLQNPYNWYRMGMAHLGEGEEDMAKDDFQRAAEFFALDNLNYAFIRSNALKVAESL
jgi:tetratricopeptide (TPR) repeat protein